MRQYPRIYDAHMQPIGDLRTAEFTDLKHRQTPFDTVTLTVPTADVGSFGYRQFVELFDSDGMRIDIFRVCEVPKKTYAPDGMMRMTCDQALCTLKDGIVPGYHQFGGTTQNLRGAIESVLSYQSEPLWVLERCDFDTHFEYGICDESPYTALLMLLEPISEAMITTDTTTRPWKLSVVRMTDEDASELRYSRNMEEIVETIQDGFFATRLYPRGYGEGVNQLTIRDVNGGVEYIEAPQTVQDTWGTVSEPYINTTITDALTLKAEAEVALELCQTPNVSYKVKAADLSKLTGEPLDAFYKGRMVRMIYRETGLVVRTRVTEIHKPKPKTEPWNAKLTLSTQPQDIATIIADLARQSKIQQTYGQGSTFIYADSFEQNCDKDTPAEGDIYIPESMIHVNAIMLKITLSAYRADSKGAAGGGGTVQSTGAGGGGTQTSAAGGLETITVKAQTVSTGIKNTGNPLDDDGGSCANTGLPTDLLGARVTKTESYDGSTAEAGGDIGVSAPTLNGESMSYTGEGGPTSTGSASGNTGTPIGTASGSAMTETGTGGPSTTGSSSPYTDYKGEHNHTVSSHTHSFSDSCGISHNHSISSGALATGGIYSGVSTVSISGTTGSKSPDTTSTSSHRHTVDSHSHSVEQHNHGMNHYHSVGSHSHSLTQHTHLMAHTHTLSTRHSHSISHAHDFDHIHNMAHVHNMEHNHTIPAQSIVIPSHSHDVSIPDHIHEIALEDHEHSIVYGIFKGPVAVQYEVEVDGMKIPESAFSEQGIGDIAPYLSTDDRGKILRGAFHTLAVRPTASEDNPNGLCRIRASWSAQVFISSLTGKQY